MTDINTEIASMPLPTQAELHRRSSLLRQAFRFVVLNVKILKLSRQHHWAGFSAAPIRSGRRCRPQRLRAVRRTSAAKNWSRVAGQPTAVHDPDWFTRLQQIPLGSVPEGL